MQLQRELCGSLPELKRVGALLSALLTFITRGSLRDALQQQQQQCAAAVALLSAAPPPAPYPAEYQAALLSAKVFVDGPVAKFRAQGGVSRRSTLH